MSSLNNRFVLLAGDVTIESEEDAYRYQIKIEESFQRQLGFRLKTGDSILTHFDAMPNENKKQKGRRKSKIFERFVFWRVLNLLSYPQSIFRTHSYEEMNPRTKQKCRNPPRGRGLYSASRRLLEPGGDSRRRRSWHNEYLNNSISDLVRWVSSVTNCVTNFDRYLVFWLGPTKFWYCGDWHWGTSVLYYTAKYITTRNYIPTLIVFTWT